MRETAGQYSLCPVWSTVHRAAESILQSVCSGGYGVREQTKRGEEKKWKQGWSEYKEKGGV